MILYIPSLMVCLYFIGFLAGFALGRWTNRRKVICPAGREDETGFHCEWKNILDEGK